MGNKSVEKCLSEVFRDIEFRKQVDFGNKASVRKYNAANDRIRRNIQYIDKNYPEQIGVVVKLLEHSDPRVVTHCAVIMQELEHCTIPQKRKAISTMKKLLAQETDLPDRIWLSMFWIDMAEEKLKKQEENRNTGDGLREP